MAKRTTPRPPRVGVARFNLEVAPETLKAYKQAAKKKNLTVSAWVRMALQEAMSNA